MLRASTQTMGVEIDLRSVGDRERDPGRADAVALLRFADALVGRTEDLDSARAQVIDILGPEAVAPAAASAGNFEMMNRLVDGVGVAVPASMHAMGPDLGLS